MLRSSRFYSTKDNSTNDDVIDINSTFGTGIPDVNIDEVNNRILLASLSCIGKPGIAVAYPPPPSAVSGEYIEPPCEGVLSRSTYDGVSEVTGVSETSGAAGLEALRLRVLGRSGADLFELFELEFCNDGRRASTVAVGPF